jgi:hypothetical protein
MITVDGTYIHGLRTRYADDGVEVYYAFPGALEVRLAAGITMPPAARPQEVVLGLLLADPDEQDPREDRSWRWPAQTTPATRRWAQHVVAADHREESLVYEHDGELVLVWASVPARAHELALLELGFTPALATWRAPATTETRTLAAKLIQQGPLQTPPVIGAAPPLISTDHEHDHADAVEHAWLRWAALMDTRVLKLQQRSYDFRAPPQRDGSALVLHYRTRNADLRLTLDVARHPLIYDITVAAGERGKSLTPHAIPGVAWADFPALVDEIARIVAGKPATPVVTPPAPVVAPPATPISGEQMEGPYRRADIWETVIASVLAGFDLPELLPLYPLTQRLTRAALTAIDEQAAQHGADYIESLRRRDSVQVARLAQLEQRLFAVLTEAEPLGALTELVRHVIGLADGSIRRPPAGTASEAFWRTWTAPGALTLRGHVFPLRSHQVLFESTTVELRYRFPVVPGAPMPTLTLSIGLPNPRGQCEVRATLWNFGAPEQSPPWTLTVPQLEKLTGPQVLRQLKPVATPSPAHDNAETWEDALVTAFKAQDARDPQLRLERRLGSGSRIFVLTMPGRRPEPIVGRVDINADLEIESVHLEPLRPEAQTTLRRRLESALEVVRESLGDDDTPPDYATARKKALTEAPPPALVDKLARHLARQREAAAVLDMRAQARTDLGAAARMVLALAVPTGPSPGETAEWLDDQRLPKSAALLSSYIFTPAVALDAFMADLSASLDAEMGTRPASWQSDGTLKIFRTTLRDGDDGPYVLEAVGPRVRTHPVTVREQDDRFARVDMGKGPKVPRDEPWLYIDGDFPEDTIREVWDRFDALLQSLLGTPVQLEDMRQLILIAAELVDAPRCQGTARGNAQRALETARSHYADARTQLQRGRDARALDRLREVLRAVVQVAHSSAESCAAGQTALMDLTETSANHA